MSWGDNGNGKQPWGQGPKKPPKREPNNAFPQNDNIEQVFEQISKNVKNIFGGGNGGGGSKKSKGPNEKKVIIGVAAIAFIFWLITDMFYIIEEGSRGVVLRFGAYERTVSPGPHFRMPTPVEKVLEVPVDVIRTEEIGFRSAGGRNRGRAVLNESLMLTGDENIVDVNLDVQWNISDAKDYLFNVRDFYGENTVKSAAESAIRNVIGESDYTFAIEGEGRADIAIKTQDILQSILDSYNMGVQVKSIQIKAIDPPAQVIDTFRDVQTARADKEREINQAQAYENDIIPRAKGEAERKIREAEAFKEEVIARAQGESERFLSVYGKYKVAKGVTKRRIYLETMEEILQDVEKIVIDSNASGTGGVLPYLPLNELKKN